MYVYLIKNDATQEIYIGVTNNFKSRLETHNARGRKHTTSNRGTWNYVYAEWYKSADDAREREKKLKAHGSGKHELMKRLRRSLI